MPLIDAALTLGSGVALSASGIVGAAVNFGYSDVGEGKPLWLTVLSNSLGTGAGGRNQLF